jgi:hypothetical protein
MGYYFCPYRNVHSREQHTLKWLENLETMVISDVTDADGKVQRSW